MSDIKVNNKYLRFNTDVDTLVESIENIGLINPLIINSKDQLIAGGRRYSALKKLGREEAPVIKVDEGDLKEELISIDENLVRKNLTDLEFENCLRRGKEIFEKLNPDAFEDIKLEDLKRPSKKKVEEANVDIEAPAEEAVRTFVKDTSDKTGLSERAIKAAILRDRESAHGVKTARLNGELGATGANELIKLPQDVQEEILPYIKEKASNVVREIVKEVQTHGANEAIEKILAKDPLMADFKAIKNTSKRLNRSLIKVLSEQRFAKGTEKDDAINELIILKNSINEILQAYESES
ncbi:ParB/RepB/Spo0J family partition protein [Halobacteriovorax sp. HLS]|uniref:ParB/RepB/Spo0J family partition protein n=1 Tax=Halobacteriovorax sp. HLS TaxID=2234000 RepID=UPI0013E3844B|nr:ParB N-terminal domain-containing protein [Halobacteriovorax sp. HLS]